MLFMSNIILVVSEVEPEERKKRGKSQANMFLVSIGPQVHVTGHHGTKAPSAGYTVVYLTVASRV